MKFRTYREVTGADASGLGLQVARQRQRVQDRLARVRRVVGIMSGKGGVGKSYLTAGLARLLAERGERVAVLDADLAGPTAAHLLGARSPLVVDREGVHPAPGLGGVGVFSADLLLPDGAPLRWREPASERFVWRGALEAGALREFLSDVAWGELDLLLVDLPPGTTRLQDLAELLPGRLELIAVTLPSEESRLAVHRAIQAAREAGLQVLGLVENMRGYACPGCDTTGPLFSGDAADALAAAFDLPVLARLPFTPRAEPGAPVGELSNVGDALGRSRP